MIIDAAPYYAERRLLVCFLSAWAIIVFGAFKEQQRESFGLSNRFRDGVAAVDSEVGFAFCWVALSDYRNGRGETEREKKGKVRGRQREGEMGERKGGTEARRGDKRTCKKRGRGRKANHEQRSKKKRKEIRIENEAAKEKRL